MEQPSAPSGFYVKISFVNKEQVIKLASLARIKLADSEAEALSHDFETILDYVGQIKGLSQDAGLKLETASLPTLNTMREDSEGHESGLYTDKLLAEAPSREGNYFKVKKIL